MKVIVCQLLPVMYGLQKVLEALDNLLNFNPAMVSEVVAVGLVDMLTCKVTDQLVRMSAIVSPHPHKGKCHVSCDRTGSHIDV